MARVLHIEDDPRNRLLVRKLLLAEGHEVVDAADGVEGVRLALAERPDLVLVDINLPGLDGYEVTLRLRTEAALARVPIIAITDEPGRRVRRFSPEADRRAEVRGRGGPVPEGVSPEPRVVLGRHG
jgi:CheY-like chemotaxis protein